MGGKNEETGCDGVDWIQLTLNGVQWQSSANIIMKVWCHKRQGISKLVE
jgi:hypothetical protein